jgi:hypothetical protein
MEGIQSLSTVEEVKEDMKLSQEEVAKRKEDEADIAELMMIESQITQQTNHGVVEDAQTKRMIHDQAVAIQRKNKRVRAAASRGEALTEDQILEQDSAPMVTKIATGLIRDSRVKIPEQPATIAGKEQVLQSEKDSSSERKRGKK